MATLILFTTNEGMITHKRISPIKAMTILSHRPLHDKTLTGWRIITTNTYIQQGEITCSYYCKGLWNAYCRYCKLSGLGKLEPEEVWKKYQKDRSE